MSLQPALAHHFVLFLVTWNLATLATPASDISGDLGLIYHLHAFLRLRVMRGKVLFCACMCTCVCVAQRYMIHVYV